MKPFLFVLFLALISNIAQAQKDPEAAHVLKQMEKKASDFKTISASFDYILKHPDASEETYQGNMQIKGKKFKMSLDETITFSNGKTRWVYMTASNEVNVSDIITGEDLAYDEQFLVDPMSIYGMYNDGFKYILNTDLPSNINTYVVDLIPEEKSEEFFKIRCWITHDYNLEQIKYFFKDGTRMTLHLKDFKTEIRMADNQFEFHAKDYPDVEIIDMR